MDLNIDSSLNKRRDPFQAIADPTRRLMIELLAVQSRSINDLAQHFKISRPAVSKHVKILEECGMIIIKKKGRERQCRIDYRVLKSVANWVMKFELYWEEHLIRLDHSKP